VLNPRLAALAAVGGLLFGAYVALVSRFNDASAPFGWSPLISGAIFAALLWLTLLTVRRLWRHGVERRDHIIYDMGVRRFGALMASFQAWHFFYRLNHGFAEAFQHPAESLAVLALAAVFGIPLGLWCGYVWGRGMAYVFAPK
jgi:hypothetical protein